VARAFWAVGGNNGVPFRDDHPFARQREVFSLSTYLKVTCVFWNKAGDGLRQVLARFLHR
jgi:hypothetical protein